MLEARPPNAYAGWAASQALALMGPVGEEAVANMKDPTEALGCGQEGPKCYPRSPPPQRLSQHPIRRTYGQKVTKQTQEVRRNYAKERVAKMEREYQEMLSGNALDRAVTRDPAQVEGIYNKKHLDSKRLERNPTMAAAKKVRCDPSTPPRSRPLVTTLCMIGGTSGFSES